MLFLPSGKFIGAASLTAGTVHQEAGGYSVYASVMSSGRLPMASGLANGSRSAKRLNQADMSVFWP